MSDALAGAKGNYNPSEQYDNWNEQLAEKYPTITSSLLGEEDWEKGAGRRPPLSIIIQNRDGKLKFSLSNPEWPSTYHCQITSATDVLGSIEAALASNMGEWVKRRSNGSGTGKRY